MPYCVIAMFTLRSCSETFIKSIFRGGLMYFSVISIALHDHGGIPRIILGERQSPE